jgi:hypothetical protein
MSSQLFSLLMTAAATARGFAPRTPTAPAATEAAPAGAAPAEMATQTEEGPSSEAALNLIRPKKMNNVMLGMPSRS